MPKEHKTIFSWQAPEFKHYPKNILWYIGFGIVVAALLVYEILRADYFGAATIAILAIATLFIARRKPDVIEIKLSNTGFHLKDLHIPYRHVKKFWIVDHPHHNTLNLETTAYLNRNVIIELGDQDPEAVRAFLREIIDEHDHSDPTFTQQVSHRLKL